MFPDVGILENSHALGIGGHHAVLDSVVYHFYKMATAVWAAVQVALFGGAAEFFSAGGAWDVAGAGRECFEDGIESLHDVVFAADHHAVTAIETPNAAAGADVDVVDTLKSQVLGSANVIDVIRITAIDQDVAFF